MAVFSAIISSQPLTEYLMSDTLSLAKHLISIPSVTPDDKGCQEIICQRLTELGFIAEWMLFEDVTNLWIRTKDTGPLIVFAGHTDVVPEGPHSEWKFPPYEPTIENGMLYGRGAADMKGSIAAFITACERFFKVHSHLKGSVGLLITSDEEGIAKNGTVKVIETLEARNEKIDYCLVGEPSSTDKVGDIIKNGRRGSLGCTLTVRGKQGHVAYPHLASNPIHLVAPVLADLSQEHWDHGNAFFPATTFQISNINGGTGATNVIPGTVEIIFNFRFSTESTSEDLIKRTEAILNKYNLTYDINWHLSGLPFLTEPGTFVDAIQQSIKSVTGYETELSTAGGTSDGRFIAPTGAQVVELGPCNATIHQINEHVKAADLDVLSDIYEQILIKLLT